MPDVRPLSDEELEAIRARAERAMLRGTFARGADAQFVAHARTDIPRLLETVQYWRERAERAEAQAAALLLVLEAERALEQHVAQCSLCDEYGLCDEGLRLHKRVRELAEAALDSGKEVPQP